MYLATQPAGEPGVVIGDIAQPTPTVQSGTAFAALTGVQPPEPAGTSARTEQEGGGGASGEQHRDWQDPFQPQLMTVIKCPMC